MDPGEKIKCHTRTGNMFSSFWAHSHDAVEHKCEKADQRKGTDAVRQSVLNGCDFVVEIQNAETALDIGQRFVVCDGFGGREIGCVRQQHQLSVEEFGTRDCPFIKAPAKTVSSQVRLDESARFRFGDGTGEPAVGPAIRGAPPTSGLPIVLSVELGNHLLRQAVQFPDTDVATVCLLLGSHGIMCDDEAMTGESAFSQARFIEGKAFKGFGQFGVTAGGDGQNELKPAPTLVRQITQHPDVNQAQEAAVGHKDDPLDRKAGEYLVQHALQFLRLTDCRSR